MAMQVSIKILLNFTQWIKNYKWEYFTGVTLLKYWTKQTLLIGSIYGIQSINIAANNCVQCKDIVE